MFWESWEYAGMLKNVYPEVPSLETPLTYFMEFGRIDDPEP